MGNDNVLGGAIRVWDRGNLGSGHGWAGNTVVFYNCQAKTDHAAPGYTAEIVISSPNTGGNYCIGCVTDGKYISKIPQCCGRGGSLESLGQLRTDIPSLYESQKLARAMAVATPRPSPHSTSLEPSVEPVDTTSITTTSLTEQPASTWIVVESTAQPTSTTSTAMTLPTPQPTPQPTTVKPATQTSTATAPSTTTASLEMLCAKKFGKCGGKNWAGPSCCEAGSYCHKKNTYYSQCKPNP